MTEATQPADERNVPAGRTRGPRCHCGAPIAHTPGKRPRVYCSERCKKAAKRAIARNASQSLTVTGTTTDGKRDRRICTSVGTATPAGQRGCEEQDGNTAPKLDKSRAERFERRDRHQAVSTGETFRNCGRKLIAGAAAVTTGPKGGGLAGVATCGLVHMCAWCSARILAVRAEFMQEGAEAHVAAGGGLVFTTHTLRHYARMAYGSLAKRNRHGLVAVLHDAWALAYGHRTGKQWIKVKTAHGLIGYARVFEDTHGEETGAHLHFHVAWFFKRPLSDDAFEEFADAVTARWASAVESAGGYRVNTTCDRPDCRCKGRGHAVQVDRVDAGEARAVAKYLFKDGDKARVSSVDGIGAELAFGNAKAGRRAGRIGPFELGDLAAAGEAWAVEKWQERERGVKGVRKMYITPNLRKHLRGLGVVDDRTDAEIAAESGPSVPLALFPAATWYRHILPVKGRRLALIEAADTGEEWRVRGLVESWGLVWGRDVLPPPVVDESGADGAEEE